MFDPINTTFKCSAWHNKLLIYFAHGASCPVNVDTPTRTLSCLGLICRQRHIFNFYVKIRHWTYLVAVKAKTICCLCKNENNQQNTPEWQKAMSNFRLDTRHVISETLSFHAISCTGSAYWVLTNKFIPVKNTQKEYTKTHKNNANRSKFARVKKSDAKKLAKKLNLNHQLSVRTAHIHSAPIKDNLLWKILYHHNCRRFFTKFIVFTKEDSDHIRSKFRYYIWCDLNITTIWT